MKKFEKILFIVVFILAYLGIIGVIPEIISVILWISALLYLFVGWRLLGSVNSGQSLVKPIFISYLISQTIVAVIFGINGYPLKNEFAYITLFFTSLGVFFLSIKRKSLEKDYPVNVYIARLVVCLLFSVTPLWTEILHISK